MYTINVERKYKEAGELLKAERYTEALHLAQDLETSIPDSPGVAMLEALNLLMLGRKEDATEACTRALDRVEAIRQNSEYLADFLTDAQIIDLEKNLDGQKTKAEALFQSFGRGAEDRRALADTTSVPSAHDKTPASIDPATSDSLDTLDQLTSSLSALESESKDSSESQQALFGELRELREADAANTAEIERARREVDELQRKLREREEAFEAVQESSSVRESALERLQEELTRVRNEAVESSKSERALKGQLRSLSSVEAEKTDELKIARGAMERLAEELRTRESTLEISAQGESERGEVVYRLQEELSKLRNEAENSSESERVLAGELERLHSVERDQASALEKARGEMARLEDDLNSREEKIDAAERSEGERKGAIAAMKAELDHLRSEAAQASTSEDELTRELEKLRSAEQERAAALEKARSEMELLHHELEAREKTIEASQKSDAERQQTIENLQSEMATVRAEAREASESEESLSEKLNRLSSLEAEKSNELEVSRSEVEELRQALREHEQTITASEQSEAERQQTIEQLQNKLESLQREAEDASTSKTILAEDLEHLQATDREKSSDLDAARSEVKELNQALHDREQTINTTNAAEKTDAELESAKKEMIELSARLEERELALGKAEESSTMRESAIIDLQTKLEEMEASASEKVASEEALRGELERFRSASAGALSKARAEMAGLQEELDYRQHAIAQAESSRGEREEAIAELNLQLEAMRAEAAEKAESGQPGQLNPQFVSWLMGYPIDWCDIEEEQPQESPEE